MVAAMCEEVQNPEREVPKAMVLSVVAAGLTGVVYLVPVLFVLPDVTALLASSRQHPRASVPEHTRHHQISIFIHFCKEISPLSIQAILPISHYW